MCEKSMGNKIKESLKNGDFVFKARRRLHRCLPVFYVRNRDIQNDNYMANTYLKLEKKYRYIIKNDMVDDLKEQKQSNKVWICWFQGYDQAPELVKCTISSVKNHMPDRDIIILTDKNIYQYAKFPKSIIAKRKAGKISSAHFSDLLRVELLCRYGGIWIDATVLCTSDNIPSYITETDLFVYKSLKLGGKNLAPTICSSWLIAAKSNNPILLLTRKLLWKYWEDYNILCDYFLFHIFLAMSARKYADLWEKIPFFNNVSPHVLGSELSKTYNEERWKQICEMSVFHKLDHHMDYTQGQGTFYQHIKEVYLIDAK